MIGIYKITSPSGKIYIGQSSNIEKRLKNYKYADGNSIGPKIKHSIEKYGWENHISEELEECKVNQLHERETYWKKLVLENYGWGKCLFCNLYDIGSSGPLSNHIKEKIRGQKRSNETKQKMREAKLGKPSAFKGRKHSEETKQKMREAKLGKPSSFKGGKHSEETKQKMSEMKLGMDSVFKGKKHSKEAKQKMKDAWKIRKESK
mgnify:CR=1 FL=1|tara:strand:+ start:112 stop:726 length:615 start_codon:yes stop_codon:yes gene_type:complete